MGVRIKDIAEIAGVSAGTVDRVLHNRGQVAEKTRKRVRDIILSSGYSPDVIARALGAKKSWRFSVIMPVSENENDFWRIPLQGIDNALKEIKRFGVDLDYYLFSQFDRDSFAAKAFDLLTDHPDGVLFAPVFRDDGFRFIRECNLRNIPVVLFNSFPEGAEVISCIGQDATASGYLAGKLMQFGLREKGDVLIINLAARKDNYEHIIRRENGFRNFFIEHPLKGVTLHTLDTNNSSEGRFKTELGRSLGKMNVKGIFVTNSRVFKVADYLKQNHAGSIHLVGYDLLPQNCEALREGWISFLIGQRIADQAQMGLITLFNLVLKDQKPDFFQPMPIDIITAENLEFYNYLK